MFIFTPVELRVSIRTISHHSRAQMQLYSPPHTYPFGTLYRATSSEGLYARALFMSEGESFSKFGLYALRRENVSREDECLARKTCESDRTVNAPACFATASFPFPLVPNKISYSLANIIYKNVKFRVPRERRVREYRSNHLSHFRPSSSYSILCGIHDDNNSPARSVDQFVAIIKMHRV